MLTVRDLFDIQAIDGLKLVAGEKGINNEITIVNIIENPDAFDWLSPNELLLSTGYIFKDNEELQNKIIKELAEINCAGLVVKMKRYFDKLPQNMIDQANKYGLPLIELPFVYPLSKVISIINEKASGRYDLTNRKTLDMHNLFFRISLKGEGIEKISSILSETIGNPIILVDQNWKLLHYTEHVENNTPLSDCLILDKHGPIFDNTFIESIPKELNEMKKSIKRIYTTNGLEISCRILTVAVSNDVYGYIIVWQTVKDLTEFDYIILEQASTVIALERIKKKELEEVKLKIKHDFLNDLLTGNIKSSELMHSLSQLHGLNPNYRYFSMVMQIETKELHHFEDMIERKIQFDRLAKKCIDLIYENSNLVNGEVTCFHRYNQIIILVGQLENKQPITVNEAKQFAHDIYDKLVNQISDSTILIGIGKQYESIHSLHQSYSEANEALRLMHNFENHGGVSHFEDRTIYHFLDTNITDSELEKFFTNNLGKIFKHDQQHGTSYIATLEYYFLNNQNISETAKMMYLHRNTLIYRIDKIKEILNTNLKNSEELLQIQLALKIFRLLNKKLLIHS